jgi:hypothetical protein
MRTIGTLRLVPADCAREPDRGNRAVLLRIAEIWSRMADRAQAESADEIDLSLAEHEDTRALEAIRP